jgi:hypothetical protein
MGRRKDPRLEKLIEEAGVDCDSPEDVAMGLCYAIQEQVAFPFPGKVVGEHVQVVGVREGPGIDIEAICERKGRSYRIRLVDVKIMRRPRGAKWIDAYLQFLPPR